MSTLIFHSLDANLHEEYGRRSTERGLRTGAEEPSDPPDRRSSITVRITPDPETRVKLTTGEDFRKMKGHLTLQPSDEPRPIASADKTRNQIGYIEYGAEYSSGRFHSDAYYHLWALIPRAQFDHLCTILRGSRMPVWMFADIEGMRLPDEFSLEWDSKAKKYLAMVSIKFSIRAAHFPSIDWDDEQEVGSLMPVTRADLRAAVEAASILNRRISSRLNWVLVGMAVLGAALFWRHW